MLRVIGLALFLLPVLASAGNSLPDNPPGKIASEWITAINSGDRSTLQTFKDRYQRKSSVDDLLDLRRSTGGFDVVRVEKNDDRSLSILVGEREADGLARLVVTVKKTQPDQIDTMALEQIERPSDLAIPRLDAGAASEALNRRIDQLSATDEFSGRVVVVRNNAVAFERNVGLADREAKKAVSAESRFRLGSMNKMFTAVAILQLVDAGKLSLDTTVGEVLADYPNAAIASKIRIRHLLSHTGGTGDIFGPEFDAHRLDLKTHADYVALYGKRAPEFEPGSQQRYSNYGFVLLGAIIEKVSGSSYYDYVQKHVYEPAGMVATSSPPESEPLSERVKGYQREGKAWVSNADTLPWRGTAAGGGLSTTADLVRFATALQAGKLISPKLLAEATRPQGPNGGYGFGFGIRGAGQDLQYGHGGGAPGMNGELFVIPASDTVVVALSNLDPPAASRLAEFYVNRMPLAGH